MLNAPVLIIFTDLDGTLLDHEGYSYQPALPVLEELKAKQIPVVPVTSKTRQEVEALRRELGLVAPFVVENGSAVFVPVHQQLGAANQPEYHLERLGCTYPEARLGLHSVAAALSLCLRGFGDLAIAEIEQLTGLETEAARRAKAREFTEPFLSPDHSSQPLQQAALQAGFQVVVGDRFSHLIGGGAGKGKATKWLTQYYQAASESKIVTVGLGNSPNDLKMLEAVDIPIVVPGQNGPHQELSRGWEVATAPGSQGWAEAVARLIRVEG